MHARQTMRPPPACLFRRPRLLFDAGHAPQRSPAQPAPVPWSLARAAPAAEEPLCTGDAKTPLCRSGGPRLRHAEHRLGGMETPPLRPPAGQQQARRQDMALALPGEMRADQTQSQPELQRAGRWPSPRAPRGGPLPGQRWRAPTTLAAGMPTHPPRPTVRRQQQQQQQVGRRPALRLPWSVTPRPGRPAEPRPGPVELALRPPTCSATGGAATEGGRARRLPQAAGPRSAPAPLPGRWALARRQPPTQMRPARARQRFHSVGGVRTGPGPPPR